MPTPIYQVDAFTAEPFKGNPAAVCILDEEQSADWMQSVAAEMNLSDTAFLLPRGEDYGLRWFTPKSEISLCGHATLATMHVMLETGMIAEEEPVRFQTMSGTLTARRAGERIELDFPILPIFDAVPPAALVDAIGKTIRYCGNTAIDALGDCRYLLELPNEEEVRSLRPNFPVLAEVGSSVMVTARGSDGSCDFVSRYFAPHRGVDEDPVTGSAHCALLPYWSNILGRSELVGYQASQRGGVVHCRLAGDRAIISGQAVTIFSGELA